MTTESMNVSTTVAAPVDVVFGVLADPSTHAAIDGTGWVRESLDGCQLTANEQVFRMAMYHDNHPEGDYEVANKVRVFDPPRAVAWEPGQAGPDGELSFGGWLWRYDLTPTSAGQTNVTLTYDWSAVPAELREHIQFPPFDESHLVNSLEHLVELATHR